MIEYKILCRAYITPDIVKMSENDYLCWHNCGLGVTLFHLLWEWPAVQTLWSEIHAIMTQILDVTFTLSPTVCNLGCKPDKTTSPIINCLWVLGCLLVKRLILCNWKERNLAYFSKEVCLEEYLDLLNMERAATFMKDFDTG